MMNYFGYDVLMVMNITDVDDKIIYRSGIVCFYNLRCEVCSQETDFLLPTSYLTILLFKGHWGTP